MTNEWENRIEDYLDNLMNEVDKAAFEIAMQNDNALAKQVAIVKEINHTIGLESKFQDFQQTIKQLNQQHFQTKKTTKTTQSPKEEVIIRSINSRRRFFAIAASLVILVVSAVLIWNVFKAETIDSTELFADNFEPYNIGQRGGNDDLTTVEKAAFENYTNGNYDVAIPNLEQLVETNPTKENYLLSLGSAYVSTRQTNKAIETFQKINNSSVNFQAAQWYLALTYLQNDEIEVAKKTLEKLSDGERTYNIKAKTLLENL